MNTKKRIGGGHRDQPIKSYYFADERRVACDTEVGGVGWLIRTQVSNAQFP